MAYNSTLNYLNLVRRLADARYHVPENIKSSFMGYAKSVYQSDLEKRYSEPMVWIGIYIALASLCCILAMLADLLHGLRSRKLWIPSMDRNGILANVTALGVLVITLVVNVCIQIQTGVVSNGGEAAKILQMISTGDYAPKELLVSNKVTCSTIAIIYSALLLLLLIIHICSSLAVLKSKEIIELHYQQRHEEASSDVQESYRTYLTPERLYAHVRKYWIMAGSSSPEYMIPCSVTTTASGYSYQGANTFDNNDRQNCWSLTVVTLTTIAITLPNIEKVEVERLYKSVMEGLEYVTLVEKFLNATDDHISTQKAKAAERLWQEVNVFHNWLGIRLKDISCQSNSHASQVDTTMQIVQLFLENARNKLGKECEGQENVPNYTSICANSMSSVAETLIRDTENHQRLFDNLSSGIADIMAACLTNLPRVIAMICHTGVIEKREESAQAAAKLLGETKQIMRILQNRDIPSMHPNDLP
ncbi:hypothetical protein HanHA89_Chr12g0453391 [Helianthus annuus]|nr:hypothetical protein HanHA89_Chr12g0453391 [Helianthus annuus]